MKNRLKIIYIFIFLTSCQKMSQDYGITSLPALLKDEAALQKLKAESFEDALNIYINMLEDEPNQAAIHSNIAVIMAKTQKPDDALKSMLLALKLAEENKDIKSLFAVNFNLGAYYGAQKKIAEALQYYQAALDINPTSKETKTNIELLIQSQNQQDGKGDNKNNQQDQKQDSKDQKDQKGQDKKDDQKDQQDQKENEQKPQEKKSSAQYKPRPYQGEQLSEGDVKKILGELRNQEQKIRANFDKKEKKDSGHEKDW